MAIKKSKKKQYIFTDRKNPIRGIMSTILGLIASVSVALAVYMTYLRKGDAPMQYGVVVLLALVYAAIGEALGIRSLFEKDIFRFFPIAGIVLNVIAIVEIGFILYLGN